MKNDKRLRENIITDYELMDKEQLILKQKENESLSFAYTLGLAMLMFYFLYSFFIP